MSAAVLARLPFGTQTALSVPGADVIVDQARSAQLGLAKNFAVLMTMLGVNLAMLMAKVRSVIGPGGRVVNLVPVVTVSKLPDRDERADDRGTGQLHDAVSEGVRRQVLPGSFLDGTGLDRRDRER